MVRSDDGVCYTSSCKAGQELVEGACVDIDECITVNSTEICSNNSTCENSDPGFKCGAEGVCSCPAGFELIGETCVDTDECASDNDCGVTGCTNTNGGFGCGCPAGHILNVDHCIKTTNVFLRVIGAPILSTVTETH